MKQNISGGGANASGSNRGSISYGTIPPRRGGENGSFEGKDKKSALRDFVKTDDYAQIDCYLDTSDRYALKDSFPVGSRIVRIRGNNGRNLFIL
jgi:hypothetical protein